MVGLLAEHAEGRSAKPSARHLGGKVRELPSLKRDCDRRTTSTGEKCLVNVHAKSRLTLEPLRTLRSETKGQAGACPDRTRAIPCTVRAVTRVKMPGATAADVPVVCHIRCSRVH